MSTGQILYKIAGISLLVLISGAGCGNQPARSTSNPTSTASSAAADGLLADALQRQQQDAAQALSLVKMAADKAPDRPDIVWLYSQLCAQVSGCQPESAEARLRRLDPANASAWLGALSRAQLRRDVAAENEVLAAMSRIDRFDIYWNSLVSKVTIVMGTNTAAQLVPTTPDLLSTSLDDAIGWISSIVVPSFRPLSESCSSARLANPATAQRCRAIAAALTRGDSYIAESVGLGIAERLAPADSPQAAAVAEQIRRSRYQRETAGEVIAAQVERDKFSREMLQLMASLRREQDVYLAVIRWAGQPTEPVG